MSKWEEKRLEDIIDVNPPVKLKKGESYPFIDIDKVSPTRRSVTTVVLDFLEAFLKRIVIVLIHLLPSGILKFFYQFRS